MFAIILKYMSFPFDRVGAVCYSDENDKNPYIYTKNILLIHFDM